MILFMAFTWHVQKCIVFEKCLKMSHLNFRGYYFAQFIALLGLLEQGMSLIKWIFVLAK